jgi:hypothetical protein
MRALRLVAVGALIAAGVGARLSIPKVTAPAPAIDSSLRDVACPSPGRCTAVGLTGSKYTVQVPMAALSEGASWTLRSPEAPSRIADSDLSAIACAALTRCVAVGSREVPAAYFGARSAGGRPLIEAWDGTNWVTDQAVVPSGTADADLQGVDCVASMCMAVGEYAKRLGDDRALAEVWDGHAWRLQVPPTPRYNGEPGEAVLSDVTCISPTSCIAVGQFRFELEGIVATIIAPLIERWDGTRWHIERADNPGTDDVELYSISCDGADRCVAVGSQRLGRQTYGTLAEIWDGTAWHLMRTRDPAGSPDSDLRDVACPRADRCFAVGYRTSGAGLLPLIESWDGRRWTIEQTATPAAFTSSAFNSIDCALPTSCQAVGTYEKGSPILHAFSATLTGGDWTILPVPGT